MALTGLAAEVDLDQVHALLLARSPALLDPESDEHGLYEAACKGIAAQVVAIAGADPAEGPYRDLAVEAITVGVAARLEAALFPEQQVGDQAREVVLRREYKDLLAQLGSSSQSAGDITAVPRPIGCFPEALPYPDPACSPSGRVVYWP